MPHTISDDDEPMLGSNETEDELLSTPTLFSRLCQFVLEPAIFLVLFARYLNGLYLGKYHACALVVTFVHLLTGAAFQNQILYQTCLTALEYSATECDPFLGIDPATKESKSIETEVQEYSANIMMTSSLLESFIPALLSLLLGPWSDKFGRRPVLLSIFTGYLISSLILIILTLISGATNISPWWFLLYSVPSILSGGTCTLITIIYCYVSDVATQNKRPIRMVLVEVTLGMGLLAGTMSNGYIYAATNALTIFSISGGIMIFVLLYTFILLPESLKTENIHPGSKVREFFRLDLVRDMLRTCFRRRENNNRLIVWFTIIALTLSIFGLEGENTVDYMFLRKKFDWSVQDYSFFNGFRIIVQVLGGIFGVLVMRRFFKASVLSIAVLALASCVLESTVRATAQYSQEMYISVFFGLMRGVQLPMGKALISQVTPTSEFGKIFALVSSLQALSPVAASPVYTTVYKSTVDLYPGAFNFISVGLYFFSYTLMASQWSVARFDRPIEA